MINVPPPMSGLLKIKVNSGDPVEVRFDHKGESYMVRIVVAVPAVWPTGKKDALGNEEFSFQIAPTFTISKEGKKS